MMWQILVDREGLYPNRAEAGHDHSEDIKKETGYLPVPNFSLTNALIT